MNDLQITKLSNDSPAGFCKTWQPGNLVNKNSIGIFIKEGLFNLLWISLLITFSANFAFAQNPSTQIEIDFSQIQGVSAGKETFTLELTTDSKLNLSHIKRIERRIKDLISQSDYQNTPFKLLLDSFEKTVIVQINKLCLIHDRPCQYKNWNLLALIEEPEKFLYPDNYYPIGSLPSSIIQKTHTTQCCYDQNVAKTLLYGSTSQYNQIINKLKNSGPSCLKQAGHAVIENLQSHTTVERPDSLSSCRYITNREDKARCDQLQSDYKIIQERITSLTNLIRENEPSLMSRSSTCLENIVNNNSLTSQINLFKQDLEDHQSCGDYGIGEERTKINADYSGEGYIIKRESNGDYTANLFIEFAPSTFYDNEDQVPKDQVQNHYVQRVQSCIDRANPYLKGPNGQKLNIVVRTPSANSCTPKNTITIWNAWSSSEAPSSKLSL